MTIMKTSNTQPCLELLEANPQRNWENRKRFCFTKVCPYIFEMVCDKPLPFINLMNFKKSVLYITSFNAVSNVVFLGRYSLRAFSPAQDFGLKRLFVYLHRPVSGCFYFFTGVCLCKCRYLSCGLIKFECGSLKWECLRKQMTLGVKFIGVPFFFI